MTDKKKDKKSYWAVTKHGKIVALYVSNKRPNEEYVLSIAWSEHSQKFWSASVVLPRDYHRAKKCGYKLVEVDVKVKS